MALLSKDVTLSRILWHKTSAGNPAGIPHLGARTSQGDTVKGLMRNPVLGERYRLWGDWKPQKGNYPDAFDFVEFEPLVDDSTAGFTHYLSTFVDGIGPVKAAAIVNEFGMDSLKVLRETPDEALKVKGITPEIVEIIRGHFAAQTKIDPVAYSALIDLFAGHRITQSTIKRLLKDWQSDAPALVKENPYILLSYPRMGWKTVDAFAMSAAIGYPTDGVERHKWGIVEALLRISGDGHTYATKADVEEIAFALLGGLPREEAWEAGIEQELIAVTDGGYALPKIAEAEENIARRLAFLADSARPLGFSLPDEGLLEGQKPALRLAEQGKPMIVAGAPGVGKTYTIGKMVAGLVANGVRSIRVVAPTGKAAKRAAELIERAAPGLPIKSTTIHKALGPIPSDAPEGVPTASSKVGRGRDAFTFSRNHENPIEAAVVIVDEASMVDVSLGGDLIDAIAPGTLLIFVGDPNQLPSVGPGSVLRDMIAAGVPTVTLTEVQRNCGTIVQACHDILAGKVPTPDKRIDLAAKKNYLHIEVAEGAAIPEQIVNLHLSTKTFDPVWDMQTISPEKGKPHVGCDGLNRLLSAALNEWKRHHPEFTAPENERFDVSFGPGDKVVRTKNGLCDLMTRLEDDDESRADWTWGDERFRLVETDIVNGDMGDVVDICTTGDNTYVVVDFVGPHRRCRLPFGDCHLIPAFAMTGHKCQGSGFPYVVLPVSNTFFYDVRKKIGLWNREMIYTLMSRAEQFLVTVGPFSAIEAAVRRPSVWQRRTRLKGLIKDRSSLGMTVGELMRGLAEVAASEINEEAFADV